MCACGLLADSVTSRVFSNLNSHDSSHLPGPSPPSTSSVFAHSGVSGHAETPRGWFAGTQGLPSCLQCSSGKKGCRGKARHATAQLMLQKCAECILVVKHAALEFPFFPGPTCQNSSSRLNRGVQLPDCTVLALSRFLSR